MASSHVSSAALVAVLCLTVGCTRTPEKPAPNHLQPSSLSAPSPPITTSSAPDDGQWIMPARDYASTRYSGLDQITVENVDRLRLAWSFSTGVTRGHEAGPLVVGSMMYVVTPFPNYLHALDLTKPGAAKAGSPSRRR